MSPEQASWVNEDNIKAASRTPLTAAGELLYGPDTLKKTVEFTGIAGHALRNVVEGTLKIAQMTMGRGVDLASRFAPSGATAEPNLTPSLGGSI